MASQWSLLRGRNQTSRAKFRVGGLKKVRAAVAGAHCEICQRVDHLAAFCPSKITRVPDDMKCPFVEALLAAPREDIRFYEGQEPEVVMEQIDMRAAELNDGNPFARSELRRDGLRARAGFWKAIGADNATISWICYGYDLQLADTPEQLSFPNAPSYSDRADLVTAEILDAVAEGSFRPAHEDFPHVVNPVQLEPKLDKWRLCHNMQYPNSFAGKGPFRLSTLHDTLPPYSARTTSCSSWTWRRLTTQCRWRRRPGSTWGFALSRRCPAWGNSWWRQCWCSGLDWLLLSSTRLLGT